MLTDVPNIVYIILALLTASVITYISIPVIINVARVKNLNDFPDDNRKIHRGKIPNLGGIAMLSGILISYSLWQGLCSTGFYPYLVAALVILFAVGMKDDILTISARKKFFAQLIASAILVVGGKIWITDFNGFLGVHDGLPEIVAIAATVFAFVIIINAFNLIDGIDGLAATVSITGATFFGIWFFLNGHLNEALLATSLVGALASFLYFNRFPARIFMGDTGSLTVGLVMAVLAFRLINLNAESTVFQLNTPTVFAFSLMIMPMYDTFRIILIRTLKGKSPLSADNGHMHHCLLEVGFGHKAICMIMGVATVIIITISFFINHLEIHLYGLLVMLMAGLSMPVSFLVAKAGKITDNPPEDKEPQESNTLKQFIKTCLKGSNNNHTENKQENLFNF